MSSRDQEQGYDHSGYDNGYQAISAQQQGDLKQRHVMKNHISDESETDPLLGSSANVKKEEWDEAGKKRNMWIAVAAMSIQMASAAVYGDAQSQWLYVRFEEMALGENFSHYNGSTSSNPCFHTANNTSPFEKQLTEAQANASQFGVWSMLVVLLPAFISNTLMGAYADQIGRRFLFILPMAGIFIRMLVVSAVAYWHLNVYFLFIGSVASGATGDFTALFMALYLYSADNTDEGSQRSFGMVLVQNVSFLFYALLKIATGYFINAFGYTWPIITGTAVNGCALLLGLFFLKETLDPSKAKKVGLVQGLKGVFSFYFEESTDPKNKRKDFILLGLVFLFLGAGIGASIQTMYLMNEPFCWSSKHIGYATSLSGVVGAGGSIIFMKVAQRFLSDESITIFCLLFCSSSRFFFAFAENDWMIYGGFVLAALDSPMMPIIRAILSRKIPIEKRGSMFGSIAIIELVTIIVGGSGLTAVYSLTVSFWRGLAYFAIGCTLAVAVLLMVVYVIILSRRPSSQPLVVEVKVEKEINSNKEKSLTESQNSIN